jgi:hypothetical protein
MKSQYDELVKTMPVGLERAVLRILSQRVGRTLVIGRMSLVNETMKMGFQANERQIREAIKYLRRQGHLICSAPGSNGGYWMAANLTELDEFGHQEFEAKISDMSETWRAMKKAAKKKFGTAVQERLF